MNFIVRPFLTSSNSNLTDVPTAVWPPLPRADLSFVGTWRDDIRIDQEAVKAYVGGEIPPNGGAHSGRDWGAFDIEKEVIGLCPTKVYVDGRQGAQDRQ